MEDYKEKQFLSAYNSFSDDLFRYCFYRTGNREVSVDMVQDIFMKAWDYVRNDKTVDNYRAFLYRIARNLVIDWYRKKKSLSLDALTTEGFDPRDLSADTGMQANISEALSLLHKLDNSDRDIILMRYVSELSPKEIAETLKESENVVSVRIHRALKKLRDLVI